MKRVVIIHGTECLARFVSELVRQGVTFTATPQVNAVGVESYVVEFDGGY